MEFSSEPIVEFANADILQDDLLVLRNISFKIFKGEFVYLIGRTGSGKSSLLRTLYADLPLKKGNAKVAGYDLRTIQKKQIPHLRRKIGIIFQDFQLLNDRTIADNLFFVMKATGWKDTNKMKARVSELMMRVGLATLSNKMPHQLSGGEQQRIVIARALINEPLILIADEPTGNLDPEVADGIMRLFKEINKSGTAILMATHNHQFIEKYPTRVLKIEQGEILDSSKIVFDITNPSV
ncbi:MAG: ATP-binding cassette domain-containing protein [Cytophagaceae bacterium]|nr:ATP-binding cassette domain-containing protein [Cytophagaceae bacterium]MDW8456965.1 ATP-binding cassette domain-containing protein [Cytophagaceae bacterium]